MFSNRKMIFGTFFGILGLLVAFVGCTRPLTVPSSPAYMFTRTSTSTNTPVATNTPTATNTPAVTNTFTSTLTFTNTFTPVPTNTATSTNTGAFTATSTDTPTVTPTQTDTSTSTNSPTFTDTLTLTSTSTMTSTPTPTNTPTPDPKSIADFENSPNNQIVVQQDANSKWRDGYWFDYDSGTNIVSSFSATGRSGSGSAVEASGSLASNAAYAGFGFNFTDPAGSLNPGIMTYDGTVSGYTGISFWGKMAVMPATICENAQSVNINLIDVSAADNMKSLPFTTAWQQFTVYYDQFPGLDPTQLAQIKWQPTNMLTVPVSYDIVIDDIQFVTTADPNPPTPVPTSFIDDFEDGNNEMIVQQGRNGYWYTYADTTTGPGATLCPYQGAVPINGTFQPSANTNFTGNTSLWCLRFTGGPFSTWGAGVGINVNNGSSYDCTQGGTYIGVKFKARTSAGGATSVRFKMPDGQADGSDNHGNTLTLTTAWQTFTLPFSGMTQEGWGTATTFMPQQASAVQWQFTTGATFDLWVDDVQFY